MSAIARATARWCHDVWTAWDRFWFSADYPHTLAMLRILAGAMLFYTHWVWSWDLLAYLGPASWMSAATVRELHRSSGSFAWSYLWYIDSPVLIWIQHLVGLVVFGCLTIGLFTRAASILAAVITLSYCHRLSGALFGLDQVNAMLALYLAVGPAGAVYSVDSWRRSRRDPSWRPGQPQVSANIAIRLIQVHMCVIYLFGGIGKMRGEMWWDGSALWYAIANYEYQSLDITWLVRFPWFIALLTHITVFWETFYPFLVWPRLTRPIAIGLAILVHGGIAVFLGMPTFGIAMITGNLAFLPADWLRRVRDPGTLVQG
ncbi:MAG: HTTM domain-containing protein [Pirellulaceae bacterium]